VQCEACHSTFRTVGDTPILLQNAPSREVPASGDVGLMRYLPPTFRGLAERSRRFVRPSLVYRSGHTRSLTREFVESASQSALLLNIGAGASDYGERPINLDIAPAPGIDVVGVAEYLPFREFSFDGVVFQAVLEHVSDGRRALSEIHRVLRPGGTVLIEVPFIQGYHAAPRDYRRYTEEGLRNELEQHGFAVDETGVAVGPASAMAWVAAEFLALLISGRSAHIYRFARLATTWVACPIKWADSWLDSHEMAHVIASGVWAKAHRAET
jgi:SAM-dependent methyltransferase